MGGWHEEDEPFNPWAALWTLVTVLIVVAILRGCA